MDIRGISSRPSATGASIDTTTGSLAPPPQSNVNLDAAANSGTETPASTRQLSSGGLFLGLMQVYENKHPQEAKAFLQGVADKLRSDADDGGFFAPALHGWADKFQKAADSGDLSNLLPSARPAGHFGIRAYQVAQQAADDPAALDVLIGQSVPPAADAVTPSMLEALSRDLVNVTNESLRALSTLSTRFTSQASDPGAALIRPNDPINDPTLIRANNPSDDPVLIQSALNADATSARGLIGYEAASAPTLADNLDPTLAGENTPLTAASTLADSANSLIDAAVNAAVSDLVGADAIATTPGLDDDAASTLVRPSATAALENAAALNIAIIDSSLTASNLASAAALGVPNVTVPLIAPVVSTLTAPDLAASAATSRGDSQPPIIPI